MSCLFCRYFEPAEPPHHQMQRVAGLCRDGCGRNAEFSIAAAVNYARSYNNIKMTGDCRLEREPMTVDYDNVCSHVEPMQAVTDFQPDPLRPGDNLAEWAKRQLQRLQWSYWTHNEPRRLQAENEKLKAKLKNVQKISARRLAALNKLKVEKSDRKLAKPTLVFDALDEAAE